MYQRLDFWEYVEHTYSAKYVEVEYQYKGKTFYADYAIDYDKERNCIMVDFQYTTTLKDWITNFDFPQKYYDSVDTSYGKIQLRVHRGWATRYQAVKHLVRLGVKLNLEAHPGAYVEVIGFSLGSGQAMLCAQDLNYNLHIKPYLYTFGSVNPFYMKPFFKTRTLKYLRSCCEDYYNFSHVNDIVSYVPPRFLGYRKLCRDNLGTWNPLGIFLPTKYHLNYHKKEYYKHYPKKKE